MFFKKKKKTEPSITIDKENFCCVIAEKSEDVSHKYSFSANADYYTVLYRNGQYLGMPHAAGGVIYPFSFDPTKPGTKGDLKKFKDCKIVIMPRDANMRVFWGTQTPFNVRDPQSKQIYAVRAHGSFYVNLDPLDPSASCNRFYQKLLSTGDANQFTNEQFREFLIDGFLKTIGSCIENYMLEQNCPFEDFQVLTASEILTISEDIYPKVQNIFYEYGLTIVEKTSKNSIIQNLEIEAI